MVGSSLSSSLLFGGGTSSRDDLVEFLTKKYQSRNIRLRVVGRVSLDGLQRTVEISFRTVSPPPPLRRKRHNQSRECGHVYSSGRRRKSRPRRRWRGRQPHLLGGAFDVLAECRIRTEGARAHVWVNSFVKSRTIKIFSAYPPLDNLVHQESQLVASSPHGEKFDQRPLAPTLFMQRLIHHTREDTVDTTLVVKAVRWDARQDLQRWPKKDREIWKCQ